MRYDSLRVASCELRVASCGLRVVSCELSAAGCQFLLIAKMFPAPSLPNVMKQIPLAFIPVSPHLILII